MSTEIEKFAQQPIVEQMSKQIGVDGMMLLNTIQAMLPKNTSFATMIACVSVASELGLNPMVKEIYFMPAKGGSIQPIVSVDGWIKMANRHKDFNGWGEFKPQFKEDGSLFSMTGTMHHKNRENPTVITEYFDECSKGGGPVWKTHPMRMMRNRTLNQLVRVAFGVSGVMDPDEFQQWQNNEAASAPIELQVVQDVSPRDGGEMPRGTKGRPASGAFKDLGGEEKYHSLSTAMHDCSTVEELQACFDGFEKHGTPWADFPLGWAKQIQGVYHYRLKDLQDADALDAGHDGPEEQLADQDGLIQAIDEALTASNGDPEIIQEIKESNADLVARCSPENQDVISDMYQQWERAA